MTIPCDCGGKAEHRIGTVEHFIHGERISVHNVPHYYCPRCGTKVYGSNVKVTPLLKEAISHNLNEVYWHE